MARLLAAVFLATMLTATLAAPMSDERRMLDFYLQRAMMQADEPTAPPAPILGPVAPPPDIDIPPLNLDDPDSRMLNSYLQRAMMQGPPSSRPTRPPPPTPPPAPPPSPRLLHLYLQQAMAQNKGQGGQTARAQFDWGKLAGSALQTAAGYYGRK